jgi:hypothetical protein
VLERYLASQKLFWYSSKAPNPGDFLIEVFVRFHSTVTHDVTSNPGLLRHGRESHSSWFVDVKVGFEHRSFGADGVCNNKT